MLRRCKPLLWASETLIHLTDPCAKSGEPLCTNKRPCCPPCCFLRKARPRIPSGEDLIQDVVCGSFHLVLRELRFFSLPRL